MKYILFAWLMLFQYSVFASGDGKPGNPGGQTMYVALDPLVINLRDEHYIQFKPVMKVNDARDVNLVQAYTPVIRFELIKGLIGRDADGVQAREFIRAFSKEAAAFINRALHDEYVKEVLFESWLIQ